MPRLSELKRQRNVLQPVGLTKNNENTEQSCVGVDRDENFGRIVKVRRLKEIEKVGGGDSGAQATSEGQGSQNSEDSDAAPAGGVAGRVAGWPPRPRLSVRTRVNNKLRNIRAAAVEATEDTGMMDLSDD
jgi:hypothetical protein